MGGLIPSHDKCDGKYSVGQLDRVAKVNVYAAKKYIGPETPVLRPPALAFGQH